MYVKQLNSINACRIYHKYNTTFKHNHSEYHRPFIYENPKLLWDYCYCGIKLLPHYNLTVLVLFQKLPNSLNNTEPLSEFKIKLKDYLLGSSSYFKDNICYLTDKLVNPSQWLILEEQIDKFGTPQRTWNALHKFKYM